jgi:hypothetical protein
MHSLKRLLLGVAVVAFGDGARAVPLPLTVGATDGTTDGTAVFWSDQFGGLSSDQTKNPKQPGCNFNPVGPKGFLATNDNTYVVVNNRAEVGDAASPVGYTLTAAGRRTGASHPPNVGSHFIVDDGAVVLASDTVTATTRVSQFNLPALGNFTVRLSQSVTATKITLVYEITNNEASTRNLTLAFTSDTEIRFNTVYNDNRAFHFDTNPAEIGFTDRHGKIGAYIRTFSDSLQGWRIWRANTNALQETTATAHWYGVPATELNVFARTVPPNTDCLLPFWGFNCRTDHLGDQDGDGFTDAPIALTGLDGDVAGTLQSIMTLAPSETRIFTAEYEYFGELACSVQSTNHVYAFASELSDEILAYQVSAVPVGLPTGTYRRFRVGVQGTIANLPALPGATVTDLLAATVVCDSTEELITHYDCGAPNACVDDDLCTTDSCDAVQGCSHVPFVPTQLPCGVGACATLFGDTTCDPGTGVIGDTCDEVIPDDLVESCNSIDDDCDGNVDEFFDTDCGPGIVFYSIVEDARGQPVGTIRCFRDPSAAPGRTGRTLSCSTRTDDPATSVDESRYLMVFDGLLCPGDAP